MTRFFFSQDFFNLGYFAANINTLSVFIGSSFYNRVDCTSLLYSICNFFNIINLSLNNLHIIVSQIGKLSLLELGLHNIRTDFLPKINKKSFLFLCGCDLEKVSNFIFNSSTFVVFKDFFITKKLIEI